MSETALRPAGTYRATDPDRTWQQVKPMLGRFGITRVAELTRLDEIGLPVHAAYRPAGLGYAVSMGVGTSVAQSRVGAVMESIENWHAENVTLPVAVRSPAAALRLGYDVRQLHLAPRSPLTPAVELDWVRGHGLLTGRETLAPIDAIRLDGTEQPSWAGVFFQPTSEGMAVGNTEPEALLHGLLEAIERASLAGRRLLRPRDVDPASCRDPDAVAILTALRKAGCTVAVRDITGPTGMPTYSAVVWSPDLPLRCAGYACHPRAGTALARAMAEAVLTRLAAVSGARDDIDGRHYREMRPPAVPPRLADVDEPDGPAGGGLGDAGPHALIEHCASRVAELTGCEPFAVRLSHDSIGIPAVKVFTPGLRELGRAAVPA